LEKREIDGEKSGRENLRIQGTLKRVEGKWTSERRIWTSTIRGREGER